MDCLQVLLLCQLLTVQGKSLKDLPMETPVDSRNYYDLPLPAEGAEARNSLFTEEGFRLYEGDMILTHEQVEAFYGQDNTRKAIGDVTYRWPNGDVPYEIDQSSEPDRELIENAIRHWMDNTCLRFQEIAEGSKGPHLIFKKKNGCNSHVGRSWCWFPDGQDISIGDGCQSLGTIVHEVGHAIGFYHEQSRPDRDKYVKIFLENVKNTSKFNFDLHASANSYDIPYDLGSIMHYGAQYFTINGKNTIVPLDPMKQFEIGQRAKLSFNDIKLANVMYNCSEQCTSKEFCQNGGFVDKMCKCTCPPNTQGNNCEITLSPPERKCGNVETITSDTTIVSPNYPQKYPKGSKCVWWIRGPQGKNITAYFKTFEVFRRSSDGISCPWDSLEVRTDSILEGNVYCGEELQGKSLTSTTNEILMLFKSHYDNSTGFELQLTID